MVTLIGVVLVIFGFDEPPLELLYRVVRTLILTLALASAISMKNARVSRVQTVRYLMFLDQSANLNRRKIGMIQITYCLHMLSPYA